MQPLQKLIPFLKEFEENFETYLMVTAQLKEKYQNDISFSPSKN